MLFVFGFVILSMLATVALAHFFMTNPQALEMLKGMAADFTGGSSDRIPYGRGILDIDGISIHYVYQPGGRKKSSQLELFYEGDFSARAVFRKETGLDRFGKQIGLNQEIQLFDSSFDKTVYVECEDQNFVTGLLSSSEAKEALKQLLMMFDKFEIKSRVCSVIKIPCDQDDGSRDKVMISARHMVTLLLRLPVLAPMDKSATPITDSTSKGVGFFYTAAGIFLIAGIVSLIWGSSAFTPLLPGRVFVLSFYAGVPLTGLFMFYLFGQLKGVSTAFRSFLISSLVGGLGIMLLCWGGSLLINGGQDVSTPVVHTTQIVDRYVSHSRKSGDTHHLKLALWAPYVGDRDFIVSRHLYDHVKLDDSCRVTTRSGLLGFEWIVARQCRSENF
jgi:hypothetical protein